MGLSYNFRDTRSNTSDRKYRKLCKTLTLNKIVSIKLTQYCLQLVKTALFSKLCKQWKISTIYAQRCS